MIGATNRPDQIDPALLRGGRLSRTIVLALPDGAGTVSQPPLVTDSELLSLEAPRFDALIARMLNWR